MARAEEEFGGAVLGGCADHAEVKAAYRLLDNAGLDWRTVLEVHRIPTAARMAREGRVLCIQDATEPDFTSQPGIAGLGRLTAYEKPSNLAYWHGL